MTCPPELGPLPFLMEQFPGARPTREWKPSFLPHGQKPTPWHNVTPEQLNPHRQPNPEPTRRRRRVESVEGQYHLTGLL